MIEGFKLIFLINSNMGKIFFDQRCVRYLNIEAIPQTLTLLLFVNNTVHTLCGITTLNYLRGNEGLVY